MVHVMVGFQGLSLMKPNRHTRNASPSMSVLLISDGDTVLADAMVSLLEKTFGFTVVGTVTTMKDAIEAVKASRPDVVLCGTGYPQLTPRSLASAIVNEVGVEVPVLVVGRSNAPSEIVDALRGPVAGYLIIGETSSKMLVDAMRAATQGFVVLGPGVRKRLAESLIDWTSAGGPLSRSTPLTERERKVLEGLMHGQTNKRIASDLSISVRTVQIHVTNLLTKLGAQSRTELIVRSMQLAHPP